MAKPKNAPALFEVIRNAQEKQRKEQERQKQLQAQRELAGTTAEADGNAEHMATSLLRSPLFWFKGRQALAEHAAKHPEQATVIPANVIPVMREIPPAPAVMAAPARSIRVDIADEARRMREEIAATSSPAPAFQPEPVAFAPTVYDAPAPAPGANVEAALGAHESYDDVPRSFFDGRPIETGEPVHHAPAGDDFDLERVLSGTSGEPTAAGASRLRERFALPLNYTTGIVAGCGVLVLIGAVYLATSLASNPKTALAEAKPNPKVLEVSPQPVQPTAPVVARTEKARPVADTGPLARPGKTAVESTSVENVRPVPVPTNVKRVYNLQYIVVLSSPIAKDAQEAVKFLADNGIPATAEQALPGYSRSWYSVITTKGFEKTRNNPEFDAYMGQLSKLMQKYAKGSKFKTFQPDVYSWRAK